MEARKHFELLGKRCEDKISGFKGVITNLSFDLCGCIQVVINPGISADGKIGESFWFDVSRIHVTEDKPVIAPPNFDFGPVANGEKGPAEKPRMCKPYPPRPSRLRVK